MKHNIFTYNPFLHDNFDTKRAILNIARENEKSENKNDLQSVLIYVNAVDYVASHLYKHFQIIQSLITFHELNSIVYSNCDKQNSGLPLGDLIRRLDTFEFPDRDDFLSDLRQFNTLRKKYVHNLLTLSQKEIVKSGDDFKEIINLGETIINKFDVISKLITQQFGVYKNNLAQKYYPTPTK